MKTIKSSRFKFASQLAEDFNLPIGKALSLTTKHGKQEAVLQAMQVNPYRRRFGAVVKELYPLQSVA